jgi:hypothetical protein
MSQLEYKTKHCKNCGHPQHCGSAHWMEVKDYGVDSEPYLIKACDTCQCNDCSKSKKVDIPLSMLNGL